MSEELEYATLRYPHSQPGERQETQRKIEKLLEMEQAENRRLKNQLESERRIHAAQMAQIQEVYLEGYGAPRHRPAVENARSIAAALYGDLQGEIVPGR